jgi:hypothetical protein
MAMTLQVSAIVQDHEQHATIGRWVIDHLLFRCTNADAHPRLLVCFGGNGHYGYLHSFYPHELARSNLLYLRDNLGPDGTGLWWLACRGDFSVWEAYAECIRTCARDCGVALADIAYIGNCLGGFGALWFSYALGEGCAVSIAPYVALGTIHRGTQLHDQMLGASGVDLDAFIWQHFKRRSAVRTHLFTATQDRMMAIGRLPQLIGLMIEHGNLCQLRNVEVTHPETIKAHSAIAYSIQADEILEAIDTPLTRSCRLP